MKKMIAISMAIAVGVTTIGMTGCTNQDAGVVGGGLAGALVGSRFGGGSGRVLATVGGALIGGFIGGKIGSYMDQQDKARMNQYIDTTPTGQSSSWRNPDTGNSYTVTPTKTYQTNNGQDCREYTTTANIAGKKQQVYGTACRQPDGTWQAAN